MTEFFAKFFSGDGFMPHGHCYLWKPGVLWLHIVSDALITLAYFSIPFTLVYFVRKRRDLEFNWMFICFAVFIVACGTTHLMEIFVIWHPTYWLSGSVKALTAVASVPTAILLVKLVPEALRLPSPSALRLANSELEREIAERKAVQNQLHQLNQELEHRVIQRTQEVEGANRELVRALQQREQAEKGLRESEARMRAVLDSTLNAVVVINADGRIIEWNSRAEAMFGWRVQEALGRGLSETIIPPRYREAHAKGLQHFLSAGEGPVLNRLVELSALRRNGDEFPVELSISPLREGDEVRFCGFITDISQRKESEKALRESERLLRQVIDLVPHFIFAKDNQSRHLFVNRACAEASGLTPEGMVGLCDLDIVKDRRQAEAFMRDDREVIETGRRKVTEEVLTDAGGQTRVLHTIKMPFSPFANKQLALLGVAVDITGLKRAEAAVRESQELLQAIIDNSGSVIYVKDLSGKYLMVNRRFTEVFHLGQQAVLGKTDYDLFAKDEADLFRAMDKRVAAAGFALTEEEVAPHDDGLHTYLSVKCPLRDNDGHMYAVFGISTDITERKLAERNLQRQVERLNLVNQITRAIGERQDVRSVFQVVVNRLEDEMPVDFCCVCSYDRLGESLVISRLGKKSEMLSAKLDLTEQTRIPLEENGLSRCVSGQLVYEPDLGQVKVPFLEQLTRAELGSLVAAPLAVESDIFGVLLAARRQPRGFASADCGFLRQLSEHVALAAHQVRLLSALQRAYDDLRQTQQVVMQQERLRALGQMASGIAHDVNNALSPVTLYTESLLEHEANLTVRGRERLRVIQRAVEDVSQTVARMREFYRVREPQLKMLPVDLNKLVGEVSELTRARWSDMPQQRGILIDLRAELQPNLHEILGVESEIREALINLVFNAVDALPSGGIITIRTKSLPSRRDGVAKSTEARSQLTVADTGIGMDEETRRRCLEPFFTTKGERGTELGLAMVYGIVQRHNGEIEIESEPGKGTEVRLTFPVRGPNLPVPAGDPKVVLPVKRLRVLIVDDDPLLLKSLREALENEGHILTAANNGQDGINLFRAATESGSAFDVVVTDLGMPLVDGRKVAEAVKETSSSTPVVLLTGWGQRLLAEGDIPSHVDQVLSKPPKLAELRATLARLCEGR